MPNPIRSILRQAQPHKKYNILCGDTHERYQIALAATGHNFFSIKTPGLKDWNKKFGDIPANYHHIEYNQFYEHFVNQIDFDFVLVQHKFGGHYEDFKGIADQMHLPFVYLEHTVPPIDANPDKVKAITAKRGDINVFLWKYSEKEWQATGYDNRIIYHGFDADLWQNKVPIRQRCASPLTIVNDFPGRDAPCGFTLWKDTVEYMENAVWGDSPGLSKAADGEAHLIDIYNSHQIYINTSLRSSLPMTMLEAASCGCAIVTTDTCAIPEIFEHNVNCLMGKTAQELRSHILFLQNEPTEAERLGKAARQVIIDKLPMSRFIESWNQVFDEAAQTPYLGKQ